MLNALGLGGAAAAAANTAYGYNLAAFQLEAGMRQSSAFHVQSVRLQRWKLYREDVRDLFQLTSDNLHTYMVAGTIFVGYSIYYSKSMVGDWPMDPPWLMLLFGGCSLPMIMFSVLSVWLAMHGTITAHTAGVKLLTQAVRLPVPTAEEVADEQFEIADYERASMGQILRLPFRFASSRNRTDVEASLRALFSEDGGPGRSAAYDAHVRLCRDMHATYACYDAYARISLMVAAQEFLLAAAYAILAFNMARFSKDGTPIQNKPFAWAMLGMSIFASLVLYKLDLYLPRNRMWVVKYLLISGPVMAGCAIHMWSSNRISWEAHYPEFFWKVFLMSANAWHITFHVLLFHLGKPTGPRNLPTAFRSVHYTDVFGWLDEPEETTSQPGTEGAGRITTEKHPS